VTHPPDRKVKETPENGIFYDVTYFELEFLIADILQNMHFP